MTGWFFSPFTLGGTWVVIDIFSFRCSFFNWHTLHSIVTIPGLHSKRLTIYTCQDVSYILTYIFRSRAKCQRPYWITAVLMEVVLQFLYRSRSPFKAAAAIFRVNFWARYGTTCTCHCSLKNHSIHSCTMNPSPHAATLAIHILFFLILYHSNPEGFV